MFDKKFLINKPALFGLMVFVLLLGACQPGNTTAVSVLRPTPSPEVAIETPKSGRPFLDWGDNVVTRVVVVADPDMNCPPDSIRPEDQAVPPENGERPLTEYTDTGTVPEKATSASVGFDTNFGLNCGGTADIILDSITYSDNGQTNNNVPNSSFEYGLTNWYTWPVGSDALSLITSPANTGQAIHVIVPNGESFGLASESFDVTPGSLYTTTFLAYISPSSVGRGKFIVKFFGDFSDTLELITVVSEYPFEAR